MSRTSFRFRIACRIGSRYAAVFPDPVFALAVHQSVNDLLAAEGEGGVGEKKRRRKKLQLCALHIGDRKEEIIIIIHTQDILPLQCQGNGLRLHQGGVGKVQFRDSLEQPGVQSEV